MKDLELMVTLWPTFPHFKKFAKDNRLCGIRLNSAMIKGNQLDGELEIANSIEDHIPLYFDIKGWQLRVTEVEAYKDHLELVLNHPISVKTPTTVLFKAGEDYCVLDKIVGGNRLIFQGGPHFMVSEGESLHIREPTLQVHGPMFLDYEIEKIQKAVKAGFNKYCLSYTHSQRDVEEFRDYIGKDAEIILKIEDKKGLHYVANEFRKDNYLSLMAARGDLYVEVDKPHEILDAVKLIVDKDPDAMAGSRILLSLVDKPVPSCADLSELAWLYDIGYRRMLLCDELCLKDQFLSSAVNVFEAFKKSYTNKKIIHSTSRRSRRIGDEYLGGGVYLDRSSRFSQFDREFR